MISVKRGSGSCHSVEFKNISASVFNILSMKNESIVLKKMCHFVVSVINQNALVVGYEILMNAKVSVLNKM